VLQFVVIQMAPLAQELQVLIAIVTGSVVQVRAGTDDANGPGGWSQINPVLHVRRIEDAAAAMSPGTGD
jgi:hypothetical protein